MPITKVNSLGITNPVAFSAGTVSLPSITTSGDTNTGVFFSAADTIDFAEGGVATGQFDSSGNFKFNSGYGSVVTAFGCRAWVNFNGTGTPAIRGSGNVTSLTDRGTGRYTINLTTALTDQNASVVASVSANGTTSDKNRSVCCSLLSTSTATTNVYTDTTEVDEDVAFVQVAIFR
jgi:hypothetical protein